MELAGAAGTEARVWPQVGVGDALMLPWRGAAADAVLSIAVLHHISTRARRERLMYEVGRVLRIGGAALVQAWALEQPKGSAVYRRFEKLGCFAEGTQQVEVGSGASPEGRGGHAEGKDTFVPWKLPPELQAAAQAAREGAPKGPEAAAPAASDVSSPSTELGAGSGAGETTEETQEDELADKATARQAAALRAAKAQSDGTSGSLVLQRFCHLFVRGEL